MRRIVRLLILTGCRREEIGALRWAEIDSKERLIRLPAERVKNARPFDMPLTDLAWSILHEQPVTGEHVFGPAATGFSSWSRSKEGLDKRLGDKVAPFVLHDIRRTVATRCADIGIMPHVIEAILNHHSGHAPGRRASTTAPATRGKCATPWRFGAIMCARWSRAASAKSSRSLADTRNGAYTLYTR